MLTVNFKFAPGDKVRTPFDWGLVQVCAIGQNATEDYYVQRKRSGEWWNVKELAPWEEEGEE